MSYFYAVHNGAQGNQVYTNWPVAQAALKGASGSKVKKFVNRPDAEQFAQTGLSVRQIDLDQGGPAEVLGVYTDGGANLSTGKAGCGVFFGDGHPFNLAESFNQPPNTNQRAELWAAVRALQTIRKNINRWPKTKTMIVIHTDSMYLIGCARDWVQQWKQTNFRKDTVKNRSIVEQLWEEVQQAPLPIRWEYVRGHSGDYGNSEADKLATQGMAL